MKYRMSLDYTVSFGTLAPYFEALWRGKALASACSGCGRVAYPARTTCGSCSGVEFTWKDLTGQAQVLNRSDNGALGFALVKFEGADTLSTVGLIHTGRQSSSGWLVAPADETPGLWLALAEEGEESMDEN